MSYDEWRNQQVVKVGESVNVIRNFNFIPPLSTIEQDTKSNCRIARKMKKKKISRNSTIFFYISNLRILGLCSLEFAACSFTLKRDRSEVDANVRTEQFAIFVRLPTCNESFE